MSIATADQIAARPRNRITLNSVLAEYGVKIVPVHKGRQPFETQARQTLKKIFADHGPAHMRDVLTCIVESDCEANAFALTAPVIKAVSNLLLAHPHWYERDATTWLSVFDRINLVQLHAEARERRAISALTSTIAHVLYRELSKAFAKPKGP